MLPLPRCCRYAATLRLCMPFTTLMLLRAPFSADVYFCCWLITLLA